ncbi:hypothetical protein Tco_1133552 [Tanacetum coccineum]
MLAPSGGGLILYQAYGNLYAMTGRKAYLLKDKQIPSVGVFDEVFSTWMAFGGNTRDLGSFGETVGDYDLYTKNPKDVLLTEVEDGVAKAYSDAVLFYTVKTVLGIFESWCLGSWRLKEARINHVADGVRTISDTVAEIPLIYTNRFLGFSV